MREITITGAEGRIAGGLTITGPARVTVEIAAGELVNLDWGVVPLGPEPDPLAVSPGPMAPSGPTVPAGPTTIFATEI